ncbi:unnamed protein product [Trichogramma brassicae]|uniref:Uncharacterized protein n=1 Tax=Trichogramma brassicae TaxID=86971 RepID=A0A6H5IPK3_9HYME|nr:unnamed protein product [Trichogramma brassicae]
MVPPPGIGMRVSSRGHSQCASTSPSVGTLSLSCCSRRVQPTDERIVCTIALFLALCDFSEARRPTPRLHLLVSRTVEQVAATAALRHRYTSLPQT